VYHLRILGPPSLRNHEGITPPSLGWGKPLALLALLTVRGEMRRDEIVDLLWRGVDEAKARNAFRQALHRLRSALGEQLIPQDREVLRLVPGAGLDIDLREFELALSTGRLDTALELYKGDFLQDAVLDEPAFDQWADAERLRIRSRYRNALDRSVTSAEQAGDWAGAIARSRRLVEIAPLDEKAARTAAHACLSAGKRTEARDVLVAFGARLQSELGVGLPSELAAMLARIDRMGDGGARSAPQATQPAEVPLPFVGREAELSRLLALWRATGDDAGSIALIEGGEGIGKSRLVGELVIHAKSIGRATILRGREYQGTIQVPLAGIADALRPLVRASGTAGASRHLLAEAARLLPELRDAFELPALASIEDEASRIRFFEGIAALVDSVAYEQPLMIVLEDVQHAGPSTLDLLGYLVPRLAASPVMFVLTILRDAATTSSVSRVRALVQSRGSGDRALTLDLAPLDAAATFSAIAERARLFGLDDVRTNRIVQRAEGVPGRLATLLQRAHGGDDLAQPPVPMRTVVQERLQSLSSTHRRALLTLSLLGRPVRIEAFAAMTHLTVDAAAESADALETQGLLHRLGDSFEADPLAAEIALESAGHDSRAFLAGWIADALAADPDSHPAEVARFSALAGRTHETHDASMRAALAALQVGAWPEAVQHLQVARSVAGPEQLPGVEELLSALGAGKPRIVAGATAAAGEAHRAPAVTPAATPEATPGLWERWFPNWRMLFGAAVATLAISAFVMYRSPATSGPAPLDTLVLADGSGGRLERIATGDLVRGFTVSTPTAARPARVPAADSLARLRPELAALRAQPLAASPDHRWVLVTVPSRIVTTDLDLFSVRVADGLRVPLDTIPHRSVVEAAWSPDGSRIAWVARVGAERQQEVFVALANGRGVENVSRHPADDYHIAWSGDGELLGFTSVRDGNAELYAFAVTERRLWRLTRDPAQDDWARFSTSGRLVAFESTRGGVSGVYVMAALGGEPVALGAGFAVREWRGAAPYLDRIHVRTTHVGEADTVEVRVAGADQFGNPMGASRVEIRVLDSTLATLLPGADPATWLLSGRRPGLGRVLVSAGGWREDTALVRIGSSAVVLADGVPSFDRWLPLGKPRPEAGPGGALLNADGEGESGLLSRVIAPLMPGLSLSVHFVGPDPFPSAIGSVGIALVAPEEPADLDSLAPQFLRHASMTWDGDARRLIFAVGREVHSEQALFATARSGFALRVEADSTLSFLLDGNVRWRSTVRLHASSSAGRVQGWMGGRATGHFRIREARFSLESVNAGRPAVSNP